MQVSVLNKNDPLARGISLMADEQRKGLDGLHQPALSGVKGEEQWRKRTAQRREPVEVVRRSEKLLLIQSFALIYQSRNMCRCECRSHGTKSIITVDKQTCCCPDVVTCVCILLLRHCCSVTVHQLSDSLSMNTKNRKCWLEQIGQDCLRNKP